MIDLLTPAARVSASAISLSVYKKNKQLRYYVSIFYSSHKTNLWSIPTRNPVIFSESGVNLKFYQGYSVQEIL